MKYIIVIAFAAFFLLSKADIIIGNYLDCQDWYWKPQTAKTIIHIWQLGYRLNTSAQSEFVFMSDMSHIE